MASPFKSAAPLLSSRRLSPIISSSQFKQARDLLSPVKFEQHLTPQKVTNRNIFLKVNTPLKDSLLLTSPHKRSLLNTGFDKEDLLYIIGKGSFGTVVKAQYKGDTVAVKLIRLQKSSDPINETNVCNLTHENIIKMIDVISSQKYGLLVMEYHPDCKNLQQVLDERITMNEKSVICYSRDVAQGLKFCHSKGVLHLDIKPKNVLLCNNVCKICDFGNSLLYNHSTENYKYQGTVAYSAPELLRGLQPTPKCDIYSLGILVWQLMSGQSPYEYLEGHIVIYKVVKFNFRPTLNISNEKVAKLCEICWHGDPNFRPSARQVCEILGAL